MERCFLEKALEHARDFQRRKRQRSLARAVEKPDSSREFNRQKKKMRVNDNDEAKLYFKNHKMVLRVVMKVGTFNRGPQSQKLQIISVVCLKCKGDHWLVKCSVVIHDEKADLLRQQLERRNREKADRKRVAND
ncbi:hypothetical protein DVH05_003694 [Phytophthora capsici]|nr:hypothetical protein DVH05_003694 [Phytophthora capsici]